MKEQVKTEQDRQAQQQGATHKDAEGVYYQKSVSGVLVARWDDEQGKLGKWELSWMYHLPPWVVVL